MSPKNGEFIKSNSVLIEADIIADFEIGKTELYFNDVLATSSQQSFGKKYKFNIEPRVIFYR